MNFAAIKDDLLRRLLAETLTISAVRVGVALVTHLNRETLRAWPSVMTLRDETGLHERSVTRALTELVRADLFYIVGSRVGGAGKSTVFAPKTRTTVGHVSEQNPDTSVRVPSPKTPAGLSKNPDSPVTQH